ncbi:MAG: DUF3850 domain-containing protein [Thermotaleaceae bacterium]
MRIHELKTIQPFFDLVWAGMKKFEVRYNDRDYKVGDLLLLKEFDESLQQYGKHEILVEVTFLLNDIRYCKEGFVIMQFKELKRS